LVVLNILARLYLTIDFAHAILSSTFTEDVFMEDHWRKIEVDWQGETAFIGRNAAGGSVQMGKLEGKPGISPVEMVLMGLAGCTGVDIADILRKMRQPIEALKIKVSGKQAPEYPMIYTEIEVTYFIWAQEIDRKAVERAIQLSEDKYCSVSAMLRCAANIHSTYHILHPGETIESM
jgi:putative redox protein